MVYFYLLMAIVIEVIGTSFLKASAGFEKIGFFSIGIACFILALFLVTLSFKTIPLGIGYAIWSGAGTAGAALIGLLIWHERLSFMNYFGMAMIVVGVVFVSMPATE